MDLPDQVCKAGVVRRVCGENGKFNGVVGINLEGERHVGTQPAVLRRRRTAGQHLCSWFTSREVQLRYDRIGVLRPGKQFIAALTADEVVISRSRE